MFKNIFVVSLLVTGFAGQSMAKDKFFQHLTSVAPVIKNHVAYLFHPQMVDRRTDVAYDISSRSNLNGTCAVFNFDHGAVGADSFNDQSYQAVVIDHYGNVVGIDTGVSTIQMLKCAAY